MKMHSIESAFRAGLDIVRSQGIPARGKDIAVLAAHDVFSRRAADKFHDPRFEAEAPRFAARVILEAYASGNPGNNLGD